MSLVQYKGDAPATSVSTIPELFQQMLAVLVSDLVRTNRCYFALTKEQESWALENIYLGLLRIYSKNDLFYKVLVMLDRSNPIGKFSLFFNHIIHDAIYNGDREALFNAMQNPMYEGDHEKDLKPETYSHLQKLLKQRMFIMNYTLDKVYRGGVKVDTILNSEHSEQCTMDVCLRDEPDYVEFVTKNSVMIWAIEPNQHDVYSRYCFTLPSLLTLIYYGLPNTYTNKPFSKHTIDSIKRQYAYHMELMAVYEMYMTAWLQRK